MIELFAKIVNGFQSLTTFAKSSISDVRLSSGYASEVKVYKKSKFFKEVISKGTGKRRH